MKDLNLHRITPTTLGHRNAVDVCRHHLRGALTGTQFLALSAGENESTQGFPNQVGKSGDVECAGGVLNNLACHSHI